MRASSIPIFLIFLIFGATAIRVQRSAQILEGALATQLSNDTTTSSVTVGNATSEGLNSTIVTNVVAENTTESATEAEIATESLTSDFVEEASELSGLTVTSSSYEGESVITFLPSPTTYVDSAPFYPFTDTSGETYVAQILESYESSEGTDLVTFNLAGEATTVEATLGSSPYALAIDSTGEVVVAEVVEKCTVVSEETNLEFPEVITETEVETSVELTTTVIEGESTVVLLPNTGDIIPNAPFEPISGGETTYVAQVLESYESSTGEQIVTINVGEGESITIEGEVVITEYPFVPVVTSQGEVEVVEVIETTVNEFGETILVVPTENGEVTEIFAEPLVEPSVEAPDQIICLEPAHAEVATSTTTTEVALPSICEAPATTTLSSEPTPTETLPTIPATEIVPTETIPTATFPVETVSTETVPTESIPTESTPTWTFSTESVATETILLPTQTIPTETFPAESLPTETVPTETIPTTTSIPTSSTEENCEASASIDYSTLDLQVPEVIAETGVETSIELTATTVESEVAVVLLPSTGDIIPNAPFEPISSGETTYVAQVLESYESSTGEQIVTINVGEGESITVAGEVLGTEYPYVPVATNNGEIEIVEVVEVRVDEIGQTVVTIPGNCDNTTEIIAEPIVEPTVEAPDQIICLEPAHAEEENVESITSSGTSGYEPPESCEAAASTTTTPTTPTAVTEEQTTAVYEIPETIVEMGEITENVVITSANVGGEEMTALVPSPSTIVPYAPFVPITDTEGSTYVAQVLESYETENGENVVSINVGGEISTFEAEIVPTESPLAPVITENGEIVVAETVSICTAVGASDSNTEDD